MLRWYTMIGSLNALMSVGLGAFGAHMLKTYLTAERMIIYETAVQYQMGHALGLILIAILADKLADRQKVLWAARFIGLGIIIFSGSLYLLCFTGVGMWGAITPIGGISLIVGWFMLALATRHKGKSASLLMR